MAQGYDERFGGELAHVVVMQHVSQEKIDMFIADLDNSRTAETMKWSAIREKEDGSRFNTTFTWKKIK